MKFLQHDGDSVVSLRFLFQETPGGNYENYETGEETLSFDTVGEIQDALAGLFENGEAPFGLQEDVLDLDAIRSQGEYTQADMVNQLARFQNNLNGALAAQEQYPDISDFMAALQEFMNARAVDLGEFIEEEAALRQEVEQYAERVRVGADTRLELAALVEATQEGDPDAATRIGLKEEIDRPTGGEVARAAVIARAEQLPGRLAEIGPSVEAAIAERFGATAFDGFDSESFA